MHHVTPEPAFGLYLTSTVSVMQHAVLLCFDSRKLQGRLAERVDKTIIIE